MSQFHIEELEQMDEAQVKALAESMGIKKLTSLSKNKTIEAILDLQSEVNTKDILAKTVEKKKQPKEQKAKRGRKPKNETENQEPKPAQEASPTDEAPKRRGRKPKAKTDEINTEDSKQPVADADSAQNSTVSQADNSEQPSKRGRKKAHAADETAAPEETPAPTFDTTEATTPGAIPNLPVVAETTDSSSQPESSESEKQEQPHAENPEQQDNNG